jgi:hypothetical protein
MPASDEHDQWTCIWGPDLLQTKPICIWKVTSKCMLLSAGSGNLAVN